MKAKVKRGENGWLVALPPTCGLFENEELDVLSLRDGLLMLAREGVMEEMKEKEKNDEEAAKSPPIIRPSDSPSPIKPRVLSPPEAALVRKLTAIRFEERTVPQVAKKIGAIEKKLLDGLVARRLIEVFKNSKYKDGVYNISQGVFHAVSAQEGGEKNKQETPGTLEVPFPVPGARNELPGPAPRGPPAPSQRTQAAISREPASSIADSKIPINSPAHLQRFGYMVLDNENEARAVMESVKDVQKSDPVKGVRGFDRKYYVLRRSFMAQHKDALLARLDAGDANSDTVAKDTGLSAAAASVLLMILADDGEVLEKKKGMWGRA